MKYANALFFLILLLTACESGSPPQTSESEQKKDTGAPPPAAQDAPPAARGVPAPPEQAAADTVKPGEKDPDTYDPLGELSGTGDGGGRGQGSGTGPKKLEDVFTAPPSGLRGSGDPSGGFVNIQELDSSIRIDIRYATTNNFTNSKIYDCPRCLLRRETAEALVRAQRILRRQGLGLKLYDCYRPRPYQQRLWDKVPNPDYVTPPEKGSMHARGAAVDLTIVDAQGNELDMGTPFDFFGPEAHYTYSRLPGKALTNRRLLRQTMEAVGLSGIRTEWWHFSYQLKNFPLSDWVWDCGE